MSSKSDKSKEKEEAARKIEADDSANLAGSKSQHKKKAIQWGAAVLPALPPLNEFGEHVQNPEKEEDDEESSDYESIAFEEIFDKHQRIHLDLYELSQDQLKLIETTPNLGVAMGQALIDVAASKFEADDDARLLRREREALDTILKKELGWSNKAINERIKETLR